jgi:hypothetical protein
MEVLQLFLTKTTMALIQPMDQGIIHACKVYHDELLSGVVNSELQITEFLNILTVKEAAYSAGFLEKITPPTTANCRKIWCHGRQDKFNSISRTRCKGCE